MAESFSEFGSPSKQLHYDAHDTSLVAGFGECQYKCVRTVFCIVNVLFLAVGVTVVAFGVILHSKHVQAAIDYVHTSGLYIYINGEFFLVLVGIVTCVLALISFCGLSGSNLFVLALYTGVTFCVVCFKIVVIIVAYVYQATIEREFMHVFSPTLDNYGMPGHEQITRSMDALQQEFKCCGISGYADWSRSDWGLLSNSTVPLSCCVSAHEKLCNHVVSDSPSAIFTEGCYTLVKKYLTENLHLIAGFGIWLVAMELLCVFFGVVLIVKIRKDRNLKKIGRMEDFYEDDYFKDD